MNLIIIVFKRQNTIGVTYDYNKDKMIKYKLSNIASLISKRL